jgi:predicted house-cleaning noncanonical NTP pyrophosphatase (MazG superfamily)
MRNGAQPMPTYNKLIRDKIPEIISSGGKEFSVRTLSDEEYRVELKTKLGEELDEYLQEAKEGNDQSAVEELADLLELIHALTAVHGSSPEELEQVRAQKAEKRGAFKDKLFLIEVQDA